MSDNGTLPRNVIFKIDIKEELVDEDDKEKNDGRSPEEFSDIQIEETYAAPEVENIAYGAMQNEEVLPDCFPVPVGFPFRINGKEEEASPMPKTLGTVTSRSSPGYILPDDGAVCPLFFSPSKEIQPPPMKIQRAPIRRTPREIHRPPKEIQLPSTLEETLSEPSEMDLLPVSNENLSERAKEVLSRMPRICPKRHKPTQTIEDNNGQNLLMEMDLGTGSQITVPSSIHATLIPQQLNEVSTRTLQAPSETQGLGPLVTIGTSPSSPQPQMSTLGTASELSTQQTWGSVILLRTVPTLSSQQGMNQLLTLGQVTVPTQQQGMGPMLPIGTIPASQPQNLGPVMSLGTATTQSQQQGLGPMLSVVPVPTQSQQSLNPIMAVGSAPAYSQQQMLGPMLPMGTVNPQSQQQNLGPMMSLSTVPTQTQQQILSHVISLGTMPTQNQQQGLGQIMPVATVPGTSQQGLGQMISLVPVPAQTHHQGLVPVRSMVTGSMPTMSASHQALASVASIQPVPQQGLHHLAPMETSAPQKVFDPTMAMARAPMPVSAAAPKPVRATKLVAVQCPCRVSAPVQVLNPAPAPTWTSARAPVSVQLATVPAPVQAASPAQTRALASEQASGPAAMRAVAPGSAQVPRISQEFNLRLPVKTEQTVALPEGFSPVVPGGSLSSPTLSPSTSGHVLRITTKDYLDFTDENCKEDTKKYGETLAPTTPASVPMQALAPASALVQGSAKTPLLVHALASAPLQALVSPRAPTTMQASLSMPVQTLALQPMPPPIPTRALAQASAAGPVRASMSVPVSMSMPVHALPTAQASAPVQAVAPTSLRTWAPTRAPTHVQTSASVSAPMQTLAPVPMGILAPAPATVQVSRPAAMQTVAPAPAQVPGISQEFNLRLPVKTEQTVALPEGFSPVVPEDSLSSPTFSRRTSGHLLRITMKDYLDFTDENCREYIKKYRETLAPTTLASVPLPALTPIRAPTAMQASVSMPVQTLGPEPMRALVPASAPAPGPVRVSTSPPVSVPLQALATAQASAPVQASSSTSLQRWAPTRAITLGQTSAATFIPKQELASTTAPVQASAPPQVPGISHEGFSPVVSESSLSSPTHFQGSTNRLFRIAMKDYLDFTDENLCEATRSNQKKSGEKR